MKLSNRTAISLALALLLGFPLSLPAQWNNKPYTKWSEEEARKLLNDSPWGQTQAYTDTSMEFSTGPKATTGISGNNSRQSVDYSDRRIAFRIRFLSAKPIRQALSRLMELKQKDKIGSQLAAQLKAFATAEIPDYIIVALDCDSKEVRTELQEARALLDNRKTADLKNRTFLSVRGDRVFLVEYQPPKKDGFGAKFIFPRMVDGKPFITPESGEVQFYSEFADNLTFNMRYKVKDMIFQGKLEY